MERKAAIDIGSNSLRLVVYIVNSDLTYKVIYKSKRTIRLGGYLTEDNYLMDEGIDIVLNVLREYKNICENYDVINIYVGATEAIRRAKNKNNICNKIKVELGLDIDIISGEEEAKYGYLAVKNTMAQKDAVILDLGGSSMEITLMKNGELKDTISLPLGCIPLTVMFNNIETEDKRLELNSFIYKKLNEICWLKENSKIDVIGISGIAKHLGRVAKANIDYPVELLHNYSISRNEIYEIYNEFLKYPIGERSKFKGLSKRRADIFAAPLGAILAILQYLNSEKFIISAVGLREGIIYENIMKMKL